MQYICHYASPLGNILLSADNVGLSGLWFEGQKYFARCLDGDHREKELPIFERAKQWLDAYFSGKQPNFSLPLHLMGTDFQIEVWELLCSIPHGTTVTYGDLASKLAERRGISRMSARAVGGAVGKNPISIIVPCHRVLGANNSITGYAGGVDRKLALLNLEGISLKNESSRI